MIHHFHKDYCKGYGKHSKTCKPDAEPQHLWFDEAPGDTMHQLSRRRTVYLIAIGLGLPLLVFSWWSQQAMDPFMRYLFPLLGAFLVWAFVTLWRNVSSVKRVERSTFWVLSVLWLGILVLSLYSGRAFETPWAQLVSTVMFNLFVLMVLSHLVFATRTGLRVNLALLGVSTLVGLGRLLPDTARGVHQQELVWFVQFEIALAVLLGFVYVLARSKDDYLKAELQARELSLIAYKDVLTGRPNRRYLEGELATQLKVSERYERPLSLISFDLDCFKSVNDTFGHAVGDEVLVTVAHLVEPLLRGSDTFGRWGGEEFLVVAPETELEEVAALAERLREAVEAAAYPHDVPVTASFGVVTRTDGMGMGELLGEADRRLYAAKQRGRNRVVSAL